MEKGGLINEIKSKYIIQHILNYSENKKLIYKIFIHSKQFQNKLNLNVKHYVIRYIKIYLKKIGFDINEYLNCSNKYLLEDLRDERDKDILKLKYNNFLSKNALSKDEFEKIINDIINEEEIKFIKEEYETKINIDSPLYDLISKTKNFENNYTIYINQLYIDILKIKEDIIKLINKSNKENIKYSSVYFSFFEK